MELEIQDNFQTSFWGGGVVLDSCARLSILGGPDRGTKDSYQRRESVIGDARSSCFSHMSCTCTRITCVHALQWPLRGEYRGARRYARGRWPNNFNINSISYYVWELISRHASGKPASVIGRLVPELILPPRILSVGRRDAMLFFLNIFFNITLAYTMQKLISPNVHDE